MKRIVTPEHNLQLALDIRRGQWLLHDAESLLPAAVAFLNRQEVIMGTATKEFVVSQIDIESRDISEQKKQDTQCVAVIPITGTITKYDSCGTIGAVSYAKALMDAANDACVIGAVLDIDSGGGYAGAIPIVLDAIRQFKSTGKPLLAHVDICASGAYWIASQCDAIFCDNYVSSQVGSIGAFFTLLDDKGALEKDGYKVHEIYATESTDKNKPYRDAYEGKYDLLKSILSHTVTAFQNDVKDGRPSLSTEAPGVLSGAMFFAADALSVGLVDGISTIKEVVENTFVRSSIHLLK